MISANKANVFDEMGDYWAEIAEAGSTLSQIQFIKNTVKAEGWILDLACGTGRHIIPLSREGYEMVGLDLSPNLLRIAKKRWKPVQLVKSDMRYLPFKTGAFTAIVSMDSSFGYLPSERDDLLSFSEVARTLKNGGLFLLDVFNRERLLHKYHKGRREPPLARFFKWRQYPSFCLLQRRSLDQKGETMSDLWVIFDKKKGASRIFNHVVRLYDAGKLQVLLETAGLTVRNIYGSYEMQSISYDSKRTILLVHKK